MAKQDSILFLKHVGEVSLTFPDLGKDDFIVISQSQYQLECLRKYGEKILSLDVTHFLYYPTLHHDFIFTKVEACHSDCIG